MKFGRSANQYAVDLIRQISDINKGRYIEDSLLDAEAMDFCIGTSGYPEKHFEAPNLDADISYTKAKINAGAEYLVTQMFFDNKKFFNYVKKSRDAGIDIPIIPGLKILTSKSNVTSIPKNFHIDIPNELADEMNAAKAEHAWEVGAEWTARQVEDLLNNKVPAIHFYIMQNPEPIKTVMNKIKL
jgi:methylenetetrahydrofolate reductase (NADPH)